MMIVGVMLLWKCFSIVYLLVNDFAYIYNYILYSFTVDTTTTVNFCRDELKILEVESFCTNYISRNCSNYAYPDVNSRGSSEIYSSICGRKGVFGFIGKGCPLEVFNLCVSGNNQFERYIIVCLKHYND